MTQISTYLPHAAIVLSLASFALALSNFLRDRPRLKVQSQYFPSSEFDPNDAIHVTLINHGRRTVILRLIGGADKEGQSGGEYLAYDKGGIRLTEHERHDIRLEWKDIHLPSPDGPDIHYQKMWVEDSLGRKYAIPNSRKYIKTMTLANVA